MEMGQTFVRKKIVNKIFFGCFRHCFSPKILLKTPIFLSPLKNDLQQKWYMCTTEAVTANYFIGYQNLANLQQKTA